MWSKVESPGSPQFLNQPPPLAQHVSLPALLMAHLGHLFEAGVAGVPASVVTVTACVGDGYINRYIPVDRQCVCVCMRASAQNGNKHTRETNFIVPV